MEPELGQMDKEREVAWNEWFIVKKNDTDILIW